MGLFKFFLYITYLWVIAAGENSYFVNIFVWVFGQNCDLILLDIGDIPNNFRGFIFKF